MDSQIMQSPNTEIKKHNKKNALLILMPTIVWTIFIMGGLINIYLTKHEITIGTYFIFCWFILMDIFFFSMFYLMYPGNIIIHADHIEYKLLEGLRIKRIYFNKIMCGVLYIDKNNIISLGLIWDTRKKTLFHGNIHSNEFNIKLAEILKQKGIKIIKNKVDSVLVWYVNPVRSTKDIVSWK